MRKLITAAVAALALAFVAPSIADAGKAPKKKPAAAKKVSKKKAAAKKAPAKKAKKVKKAKK